MEATCSIVKPSIRDKLANLKVMKNIHNYFGYYKKTLIALMIACMIGIIGIPIIANFAGYSAERCTWKEIQEEKGQAATDGHSHQFTKFLLDWSDDIFGAGQISSLKDVVYIEYGSTSVVVGGVTLDTKIVNTIYEVFQGLGVMFVIVYFCIGLLEELSFNQMYAEKMVKKFMFLAITIGILVNADSIVYGIANLGSALVDKIADVLKDAPSVGMDDIKTMITKATTNADTINGTIHPIKHLTAQLGDLATSVGYVVAMFVPWVFAMVCNVMVQMQCWSRFFEILIMAMVSPLAFADIARGNIPHSNAMRAVKNIVALSISGAMILIIFSLTSEVKTQFISSASTWGAFMTAMWNSVLISMVQVGLIHRTTDITKQALGMS